MSTSTKRRRVKNRYDEYLPAARDFDETEDDHDIEESNRILSPAVLNEIVGDSESLNESLDNSENSSRPLKDSASYITCPALDSDSSPESDVEDTCSEVNDHGGGFPKNVDDSDDNQYDPEGGHGDSDHDAGDDSVGNDFLDARILLTAWANDYDITHSALRALLAILILFIPGLPKSPTTLLQTGSVSEIRSIGGGNYYHFGVATQLRHLLTKIPSLQTLHNLRLQFNIDGLPIFKSSGGTFWPILAKVMNPSSPKPFVVGLFYGIKKPESIADFLQDFVEEMLSLTSDGFKFCGKSFPIVIASFVCDAPARSFLKCCKAFNGYSGCEKCIAEGDHEGGRMFFTDFNAPLRTDRSFAAMTDEEHHTGTSPLTRLDIGLVSQVPLDYMHLVLLGVVKKLIRLWRESPRYASRLPIRVYQEVSEVLVSLTSHVPRDFSRRPRALSESARWKATEFRTFLLYTGPVALRGIVPESIYGNFLLLSCGIHILANPTLFRMHNSVAQELLVKFVKHFSNLYGEEMLVYNFHNLIHLCDDVLIHGPLDQFSAFPYENFLYQIKRMVRKPNYPLQQVILRLREKSRTMKAVDPHSDSFSLRKEHTNGPFPEQRFLP